MSTVIEGRQYLKVLLSPANDMEYALVDAQAFEFLLRKEGHNLADFRMQNTVHPIKKNPAFAADILRLLQSKASDISSSIKEVNKMIKDNVTTTEAGDFMDFMDFMDGDSEDVLVDT